VAPERDVVVTAGTARTEMVSDAEAVAPKASVASTVNVCVVADGSTLPVMAPLEGVRLSPLGSEPLGILQVNGVVPPTAVSVWEYADWVFVASASDEVDTVGVVTTVRPGDAVACDEAARSASPP